MKTYIFMSGIANIIAGGPIYNSNKIKTLENNGWNVIVFPTNFGKIYIKPLEKYNSDKYKFLNYSPHIFSKRKINNFIETMVDKIQPSESIVIETGTDFTALWGELLAKEIGARHIVMFLDEKNDNVNNYTFSFYEFKYKRNELYSISKESLLYIFGKYFNIKDPEKNVWNAWCSNVVADEDSDIRNQLPKADFMIGSIGRLDKPFVLNIINGVCSFANIHSDICVGLCFFGGADEKTVSDIKSKFKKCPNIKLFISGYIWPIPKSIFNLFDVFVSGAGSAVASANMGVTTVDMDVITNSPNGFIDNLNNVHCTKLSGKNDLLNYLESVYMNDKIPEIINKSSIDQKWQIICNDFNKQIEHVENLSSPLEYFDTSKISDHSVIRKIQFLLAHLLSFRAFLIVQETYYRLRKLLKVYE
ncbi:hypothetical protein [uncultured Clostridium sp.]|uniref:hypothetical protein n=1 Tax=uncultured Clostridium sp. TaxID=59620 RepID=UPI0025E385BF|nr:hypothetical protein [uncultured Clostridium sp.]